MQLNRLRLCAAAAILTLSASCSGEKAPESSGPPAGAKRVDNSKAGSVAGRVVLDGAVPANPPIQMTADPFCAREHPNGARFENFVVDNGGLENVFVYVKDGLNDYYFDVPAEPVKLDQQGCRYVPHVTGLRVRQPLLISNSDDTMHNVHAEARVNEQFNVSQAMKNLTNTKTFTRPEVMVPFKCNVHNWMHAYVGVLDHPYFAVTHGGGKFELTNLPAGRYTVEAWHEKLGAQAQAVTLGEKASKEITFTFKAVATN